MTTDDEMRKANEPVSSESPLARLLGMHVLEAGEGQARVHLLLADKLDNWIGRTHGGALAALADRAVAAAAETLPGRPTPIQFHLNLLASGRKGDEVVCTARALSVGRRVAIFAFELRDSAQRLLAQGQSTALCQIETSQSLTQGVAKG